MRPTRRGAEKSPEMSRRRGLRARIALVFALIALALVPLGMRLVQLQITRHAELVQLGEASAQGGIILGWNRGAIVDRFGQALAETVEEGSVAIAPHILAQAITPKDHDIVQRVVDKLSQTLQVDPDELIQRLNTVEKSVWVKRAVTPAEEAAVAELKLVGVRTVQEPKRYYYRRDMAARVLGRVNLDGDGVGGIEQRFNKELRGDAGKIVLPSLRYKSAQHSLIEGGGSFDADALRGARITLTLDPNIQSIAEAALAKAMIETRATTGAAVVYDPKTGELLAIAELPSADLNDSDQARWMPETSWVASGAFEPGSTVKPITIAAALDLGEVTPDTIIDTGNGVRRFGKENIHDHKKGGYGSVSVSTVMKVSSNIGAALIAQRVKGDRLADYFERFGFYVKAKDRECVRPRTGLNRVGCGLVEWPKSEGKLAAESFGQSMSVTPLQLVAAYGALANGGVRMEPYAVSSVVAANGERLYERSPNPMGQAVSAKTAAQTLAMMRSVVEKGGSAEKARVEGYAVAGKTGTAQKFLADENRYSDKEFVVSFIGVVPADAPKLVIGVWLDVPRARVFGGVLAAPVFKEIAEAILPEKRTEPPGDREKAPEEPASARARALAARRTLGPGDAAEGYIESEGAAARVVPDVMGLSARDAVRTLAAAGFEPSLEGRGTVIDQRPAALSTLSNGSVVELVLESPLSAAASPRGEEAQ